jgi:hypothetical protein
LDEALSTSQNPAKTDFADNSPSRDREEPVSAVVATFSVSVDADIAATGELPFGVRLDTESGMEIEIAGWQRGTREKAQAG